MRALRIASLLTGLLLALPGAARAQQRSAPTPAEEPTPDATEAPAEPEADARPSAAPPAPLLPLEEDNEYWLERERRLSSTLQIHASVYGTRRRTFAAMSMVAGLVLLPMGAIADVLWDEPYGLYLWTFGGAAILSGAIAGFASSPIERVQREYLSMRELSPRLRVTTTERLWAEKATRRRRLRIAAFGSEIALGTAALTMAFVVGLGDGIDWTDGHRRTTAVATGIGGTVVLARGITHWFAMSDIEAAHLAYERSVPTRPIEYTLGAAAVRGGAIIGMHGTF